MAILSPILKDRFIGCFLGLAIGDALGGLFEAQAPTRSCSLPNSRRLDRLSPGRDLVYR